MRQGKRVSASCVHGTAAKQPRKTRKLCPPGKIPRTSFIRHVSGTLRRQGYTTRTKSGRVIQVHPKKSSVYVPSTCVKDVGHPGKGQQRIGPLRKGQLRKFGYSYKEPEAVRRAALLRAIAADSRNTIYHRLDAVAKLTVSTAPEASRIFAADRDWVRLQRQ